MRSGRRTGGSTHGPLPSEFFSRRRGRPSPGGGGDVKVVELFPREEEEGEELMERGEAGLALRMCLFLCLPFALPPFYSLLVEWGEGEGEA